jgi:hypothetical protein
LWHVLHCLEAESAFTGSDWTALAELVRVWDFGLWYYAAEKKYGPALFSFTLAFWAAASVLTINELAPRRQRHADLALA